MNEQSGCGAATHDEICDGALAHYREVASSACHWSNTVEKAIQFYREHGPQAPTQPEVTDLDLCPSCNSKGWAQRDGHSDLREFCPQCDGEGFVPAPQATTQGAPDVLTACLHAFDTVERCKLYGPADAAHWAIDKARRLIGEAGNATVAAPQGAPDTRTDAELVEALAQTCLTLGARGGELGSMEELQGDQQAILERFAELRVASQEDLDIIAERDLYNDWADTLAYAVAPIETIGEHSNANNPWQNALDILEQRAGSQGEVERLREATQKVLNAYDHMEKNGGGAAHLYQQIDRTLRAAQRNKAVAAPQGAPDLEETREAVGQLADRIENLVAAANLPMPADMHLQMMLPALKDISAKLAALGGAQ